jgi:uncharacterized caspase-like protein
LPSSGDGSGELYLVPQDAYAFDDRKGFVAFSEVLEILEQSEAKQRLIILDACLSGPDLKKLKSPLDKVSYKFLQEYLDQTVGSAVLSSCGIDETSTTQSPNPSLSLFTHYFCEALLGNKDALENGRLTLNSLYSYLSVEVMRRAKTYHQKQKPTLKNQMQGIFLLGDFTTLLAQPASI